MVIEASQQPLQSQRGLYEWARMARLLAPASIAVVGVSEREGSFGRRTWENLSDFRGALYPVHPGYGEYQGQPCYARLCELPEVPDCVVVCTGRDQVQAVLEECAKLGVGGVVVFASGYAEAGTEGGVAEQQRLAAVAREAGVALLGPNCMGVINSGARAAMTFAPNVALAEASPHAIALVSQSGAIGSALLQAAEHGTVFSHMLTSGNAADVDAADQIAYLAGDDSCRAIACVLESIPSSARFIEAGQLARAAGKPVVVYKVARTPVGAEAAQSHTGAMMASDAASRAVFRAAGMVLVDDLEHLVETAVFMAKAARLSLQSGVAVLTASGGLGIQAADSAFDAGVSMPQPNERSVDALRQTIPPFGSARNPCDVTAQVVNDLGSLGLCAHILLDDPAFGLLVYPHTGAHAAGLQRLQAIEREAERAGKLACFVWSTAWLEGPGALEAERMAHGAVFRSMRACFNAMAALERWRCKADPVPMSCAARRERLDAVLKRMAGPSLSEGEGMELLRAAGLPVVQDRHVNTAEQAEQAAREIARPVVMKIVSRDIAHKSDVGGVVLNVQSPDEAGVVFSRIMDDVATRAPQARLDGVVLQPMIPAGIELILGARKDPAAGMLVMVGFGGVLAELLADVTVRVAPFTASEGLSMLDELRGSRLLAGYRGLPAADRHAIAEVISRFSVLAADLDGSMVDMEINPLICLESDVIAVDALIRLAA